MFVIKMKKKLFLIIKMTTLASCLCFLKNAHPVEFNTEVIDASDRENIDFSRFSQAGYIMPGQYQMHIVVNGQGITANEMSVTFINDTDIQGEATSKACITPEMLNKIGLTQSSFKRVTLWHHQACADITVLPGSFIKADLSTGLLNISIPTSLLEYSDASWLPPSRWENGIPGLLFGYNINGNLMRPNEGSESQSLSYNGTAGANTGPWRLRGDYQGNLNRTKSSGHRTQQNFDWTRFYLYRALPQLGSKLTFGENYINSNIFSGWSYTGVALESDDRMLPPRLRGYAPQITGIAETNARVIVKQNGRVLYDSTVAPGPFNIQDLDSSIRGRLDVEVVESNGQKKTFDVNADYVPYLTRPGQLRYKLVGGQSRYVGHDLEGPIFTGSEMSWGVSNNWSLYGGGIFSDDYNAVAAGVGRDFYEWGALSADITQSTAKLDGGSRQSGKSWRLSYSKHFDEAAMDITFAGYRFSERNYMTMQNYLDARYRQDLSGRDKELYTVSLRKYFPDRQMSLDIKYNYQTYWSRGTSNYYTVSLNQYMDILGIKNLSIGFSVSRTKYLGRDSTSGFLRVSVPLNSGMLNYNGSMNDSRYTQTIGYSDIINNGMDSYSINAGINHGGNDNSSRQFNGYYSHHSPIVDMSASMATVQNSYSSLGFGASGGATLTLEGAALHSGGLNGTTRMLVSTDGIGGVPVDGGRVVTNRWGTGVVTDVSSYYRNTLSVDINTLPDDIYSSKSVVDSALTEGAIGFRKFEVLKGKRLFAVLRMDDNTYPPFGASVLNGNGREIGMVDDSGLAWLSGVNPGEVLSVSWNGKTQCISDVPKNLQADTQLLLPCHQKQ